MLGTIGVDPGMEFHAAAVALVDHPLQRVPVRRWCLALHARQELAPGFYLAGIECIALGSDLEDNGIDAILLQFVELPGKHRLNLLGTLPHKLSIDALNPCATELSLVLCHQRRRL